MWTILVKTIVNTNNNTLAKSIADTITNTAFEKYCQYQYQYFLWQYFLLFLANVNSRSRSLYVVVRPSVVCLSVTFVHPTQAIEIFGNLFTPFGT